MTRSCPEDNCPPAVGAAEGRCTAYEAGAKPTYGNHRAAGKRFSRPPVLTGNNIRAGVPGCAPSPSSGNRGQPPNGDDAVSWSWRKRGGEVRMDLNLFKGRRILNLRWWAETNKGLIPTKEGVTIPLEAIEDFERAVTAISAAARSDTA